MKHSTMTLEEARDLLPRTLRQRYSGGAFPWKVANLILAEFEKELEDHYFIGEVALLLEAGKTDYVLPATVRKLRGIYQVVFPQTGVPYRPAPVDFIQQEQSIRLDVMPILSEDDDITGTVPAGGPGTLDTLFDDTAGKLDADTLDEDALAGRLLRVTHAGGAVEYKLLSGNTPEDTTAEINGALAAVAAEGDTYLITANFYMMEVVKYLTRLTALEDTLPIPQDWEAAFIAYLRYYYEAQSEEGSANTSFWFREMRRQLVIIKADGRHRGDTPKRKGRSIPPLFS